LVLPIKEYNTKEVKRQVLFNDFFEFFEFLSIWRFPGKIDNISESFRIVN